MLNTGVRRRRCDGLNGCHRTRAIAVRSRRRAGDRNRTRLDGGARHELRGLRLEGRRVVLTVLRTAAASQEDTRVRGIGWAALHARREWRNWMSLHPIRRGDARECGCARECTRAPSRRFGGNGMPGGDQVSASRRPGLCGGHCARRAEPPTSARPTGGATLERRPHRREDESWPEHSLQRPVAGGTVSLPARPFRAAGRWDDGCPGPPPDLGSRARVAGGRCRSRSGPTRSAPISTSGVPQAAGCLIRHVDGHAFALQRRLLRWAFTRCAAELPGTRPPAGPRVLGEVSPPRRSAHAVCVSPGASVHRRQRPPGSGRPR